MADKDPLSLLSKSFRPAASVTVERSQESPAQDLLRTVMRKAIVDLDEEYEEEEALDLEDERPLRRGKGLVWLCRILFTCASVAALAYLAEQTDRNDAPPGIRDIAAPELVAPAPLWQPLPPSPPVFAIDRSAAPVAVEARRHRSGGREDTLAIGTPGSPDSGRIVLAQGIAETSDSFFVDLVRRAAQAGLSVTRNAQSTSMATKFGPVETAEVTLAGEGERNCRAFRFIDPEANFAFRGWLCGSGPDEVEEARVACLIDRIVLADGDNAALRAVFARAERNRLPSCGAAPRTAAIGIRPPARP